MALIKSRVLSENLRFYVVSLLTGLLAGTLDFHFGFGPGTLGPTLAIAVLAVAILTCLDTFTSINISF